MLEIGEQQGATDCCEFCKAAGAVEEGLAAAIKQQSRLASWSQNRRLSLVAPTDARGFGAVNGIVGVSNRRVMELKRSPSRP
jgi:hypothetical protein